ncbi:phage tail tape measure protein [uncultured Clostridium sp.]|uniref:phage tail tape measure protein n=1 Tax=uncultured Clostridium sp. TaxID=59620 RepID=UPI0025CC9CDF|nr:phage tail tape measure protein [uncultured Clostridium sp.]
MSREFNVSAVFSVKDMFTQPIRRIKEAVSSARTSMNEASSSTTRLTGAMNGIRTPINNVVNGLRNLISNGFNRIRSGAQTVVNSMNSISETTGAVVSKMKVLSATATVAIGAGIKQAGEFSQAMAKVKGITNADAETMKELTATAKDFGGSTAFTATQCANALGYMGQEGWSARESMDNLQYMLATAGSEQLDLAQCTSDVIHSMMTMGMTSKDTATYVDRLSKVASSSGASVDNLMKAYSECGGQMKALHIPLEESSALLGALASHNIAGAEAGNALQSVLVNFMGPTSTTSGALKTLGVSLYDSTGKTKDFVQVLRETKSSMASMTDQQRDLLAAQLGGKTQLATLNALLDACGDEYDEVNEKAKNALGVQEKYEDQMQSLGGQIEVFKSAISEIASDIGQQFAPALKKVNDVLKKVSDAFKENNGDNGLAKFSARLLGVVAVSAPVLKGISKLTGVIGKIGKACIEHTGIIGKIISSYGKFNNASATLLSRLGPLLNPINLIKNGFKGMLNIVTGVPKVFKSVISSITSIPGLLKKLGSSGLTGIRTLFTGITTLVKHPISSFKLLLSAGRSAFTAIRTAIMGVMSPAGIVIAIIALVVAAVVHLWKTNEQFRNVVMNAWERIKQAIGVAVQAIQQIIAQLQAFIQAHQAQWEAFKVALGVIWEAICAAIGAVVITIIDIITGIVTEFANIIQLIADLCSGNWAAVWEDFKKIINDAIEIVKGWWSDLVGFFTNNPIVASVKKVFSGGDESHGEPDPDISDESTDVDARASGDDNYHGGLTTLHENGYEVYDLPQGTRIFNHDASVDLVNKMASRNGTNTSSITIAKLADSIVVREEADIDKIASSLARKLKIEAMKKGGN